MMTGKLHRDILNFSNSLKENIGWRLASASPRPSTPVELVPRVGPPLHLKRINVVLNLSQELKNLHFVHVGKCGGTSIVYHFLESGVELKQSHRGKPDKDYAGWYFLWVRNPIKRFVSAFNHVKAILDFDISGLDFNSIDLENCISPASIRKRITTGYAFNAEYEALVRSFDSANELAESLSSSSKALRQRAEDLMFRREAHIFKGIGWFLSNGLFVEKKFRQLLFVGRLEEMDRDFSALLAKIEFPQTDGIPIARKRVAVGGMSCELSSQAIDNIIKFYAQSDYKALDALGRRGFLKQEILDEYRQYVL